MTMAQELRPAAAPPVLRNADLDREAVWQARVDLAACFRMAAKLGLHEGVCNHLSAMVPGRDDLFLVNPMGWAFGEVTASRLLMCDFHGNVIEGHGAPEATAFYIHGRLHLQVPRARAAFHTHMPNATALTMLEGPPLSWALQSALKFYGRTVVDEEYNGLALDEREGDRIAASLGDADIVFMRNHGVLVVGRTTADAWDDLYYLERACEAERLALSTGRKLKPVPAELADRTYRQMLAENQGSAQMHLTSIRRVLDREQPEYRT
jgi:ribulose-5-phosphate 4-epimerase/fuculose-1-phosphate aldolase